MPKREHGAGRFTIELEAAPFGNSAPVAQQFSLPTIRNSVSMRRAVLGVITASRFPDHVAIRAGPRRIVATLAEVLSAPDSQLGGRAPRRMSS
jgi:hypothetical protein